MSPSRDVHGRGFCSIVLYGGSQRSDQLQTLRRQNGTHFVVATPGRLDDFLTSGHLAFRVLSLVVLDEADKMLEQDFESAVASIFDKIEGEPQVLLFSATWRPEVEDKARRLCRWTDARFAHVSASVASSELPGSAGVPLPPATIRQIVEVLPPSYDDSGMTRKMPLLLSYLNEALGKRSSIPGKVLIFVSQRNACTELRNLLMQQFKLDWCGVMHGGVKQQQRENTLESFRDGRIRVLIGTDVLGRGLDVDRISHVVNFDFPFDMETYVHRVGRTGRNGQPGTAISFFEAYPGQWYTDLAQNIAGVLRACGQKAPAAWQRQERSDRAQGTWNC